LEEFVFGECLEFGFEENDILVELWELFFSGLDLLNKLLVPAV
jgi:hypothetical protein